MPGPEKWIQTCNGTNHRAMDLVSRMRWIAVILSVLCLLAQRMDAESVIVVAEPTKSSSHPKITVVDHGRPVPGAKVEVYRSELSSGRSSHRFAQLKTNRHGVIPIASLSPGYYQLSVQAEPCSSGFIMLEVLSSGDGAADIYLPLSAFTEDSAGEPCPAVARCLSSDSAQVLRGTVFDQTVAPIPDSHLVFLRDAKDGGRCSAVATTDRFGQFQVDLPQGSYAVSARALGFKVNRMSIQIKGDKVPEERHIVLVVGSTT
jgi:hypothetical protein